MTDIIKVADERTLVMCLIETAEGIDNVDKIAAVPGVDVLWLGHFDLTNFLGHSRAVRSPEVPGGDSEDDAAAKKHGKVLACMTADDNWSREYWDLGFRLFCVGVDDFRYRARSAAG